MNSSQIGHTLTLWAETTNQLVLVLIGTTFPAAVRMTIIDRRELLKINSRIKFAAIITGNRLEHLLKGRAILRLDFLQTTNSFTNRFTVHQLNNFKTGLAFCQNQKARPFCFSTYYSIHFPVTRLFTAFRHSRPLGNGFVMRMLLGDILFLLFPAMIPAHREINGAKLEITTVDIPTQIAITS